MNLEVNLGGIRLANPVVMASGRYAVVKLRRGRGASFAGGRCPGYGSGWSAGASRGPEGGPVPRISCLLWNVKQQF